jgi:hypothetical protein
LKQSWSLTFNEGYPSHKRHRSFAILLVPDDPYEYLPFIETHARLGRVKEARLYTRHVTADMPFLRPVLCAIWMRVEEKAGVPAETVSKIKTELQSCLVP